MGTHKAYYNIKEAIGSVKWDHPHADRYDGTAQSLINTAAEDLAAVVAVPVEVDEAEEDMLGFTNSLIWLAVITVLISLVSDGLASSIETGADSIGVSATFLAAIVIPIIGNAAEHASAIIFGYKGRATLAVSIAMGSSLQIGLFVLPLLIFLAWMSGIDVDLDFGGYESFTLFVAALAAYISLRVGETTCMVGAILVGIYLIFAIGFYARTDESLYG